MGLIFAALTEQPAALRVAAATCKQWRQHAKDVGLLMHLVGSTPGNRHSGYLGTYIICNTFFHGRPSYVQLGDPGKMLWYSRKAGWFAGITPEAGKGRGRLCNDSYALAPQLITTPWEIQALPAVGGWEAAAGLRSGIDAEAELEASQHRKAADAQRAASAEMIYITSARGALTGLAAKCVGAFSRIPGAQYNWRPAYLKQARLLLSACECFRVLPSACECFRVLSSASDGFRWLPMASDGFGSLPIASDRFRSLPIAPESFESVLSPPIAPDRP